MKTGRRTNKSLRFADYGAIRSHSLSLSLSTDRCFLAEPNGDQSIVLEGWLGRITMPSRELPPRWHWLVEAGVRMTLDIGIPTAIPL